MTFALVTLGAGVAVSSELLEALAIVLAVGVGRRWSEALVVRTLKKLLLGETSRSS